MSRLPITSIALLAFISSVGGAPFASMVYDVRGYFDSSDLLILKGSTVQWHHDNTAAAVGRHGGNNYPTTIISTVDGVVLQNTNWIPTWPSPVPNEIRFDAFSSLGNLVPAVPMQFVSFGAIVLDGRGSVTVVQFPVASNDFTAIVRFSDGASGAAFLRVQIAFQFAPEPAPLLELHFNETGTNALGSGLLTNTAVIYNAANAFTDLHSTISTGVSGVAGDRAFDNSSATGMGTNGIGGRVDAPSDAAFSSLVSLTLQGWMRASSMPDKLARLIDKQNANDAFALYLSTTGRIALAINNLFTEARTDHTNINEWIFFAATYDNTAPTNQVKFFKGTPNAPVWMTDEDDLHAGLVLASTAPVRIGNFGNARPFQGMLDNVRVFGSKTDSSGALNIAQLEWLRQKDLVNSPGVSELFASRSSTNVMLKWPVYPRLLNLQVANQLGLPSWMTTEIAVESNDFKTVTVSTTNAASFFRLAP